MSIETLGARYSRNSPNSPLPNVRNVNPSLLVTLFQSKANTVEAGIHTPIDDISESTSAVIALRMHIQGIIRGGYTSFSQLVDVASTENLIDRVAGSIREKGFLVIHAPDDYDTVKNMYHHFNCPGLLGAAQNDPVDTIYIHLHLISRLAPGMIGMVYGGVDVDIAATFLFHSEEDAVIGKDALTEWLRARKSYPTQVTQSGVYGFDYDTAYIPYSLDTPE